MEGGRGAEERPDTLEAPQGECFEAQECEDVGEAFGFDAADHPFAGHVAVLHEADEKGGGPDGHPAAWQDGVAESPPCPGEESPGNETSAPGDKGGWQEKCQPA